MLKNSTGSIKMKRVPRQAFWRQILVLLPVYFNVLMMGCTTAWGSVAVYFFTNDIDVSANSSQLALIISLPEIGRLLLAIPGGMLVDKFGRKKVVLITAVLHSLGYLILSLSAQVNAIYMGRFLLGIAAACVNATAMTCIGEIASPEIRAKLTGIYQQFILFGSIYQVIFLALFSSYFTIQYCTAFLSLLSFILFFCMLETPDYLISISQYDKAFTHFKYIRPKYSEDEINIEFEKTKQYVESERENKNKINWLKFIKSSEIKIPLVTIFFINFFYVGGGSVLTLNYVTSAIPTNQYIPNEYFPPVYFATSIFVILLLPLYVERFRRRVIFMWGILMLLLNNVLLTVTYIVYIKYNDPICKWVYTFAYIATGLMNWGFVQPMVSVTKSEILPQSVRGLGGSISVIGQSLAFIVFTFVFNYIWSSIGLQFNFIIFAGNWLVLFILIYFRLPESRGKLLADIQTERSSK